MVIIKIHLDIMWDAARSCGSFKKSINGYFVDWLLRIMDRFVIFFSLKIIVNVADLFLFQVPSSPTSVASLSAEVSPAVWGSLLYMRAVKCSTSWDRLMYYVLALVLLSFLNFTLWKCYRLELITVSKSPRCKFHSLDTTPYSLRRILLQLIWMVLIPLKQNKF